MKKIKCIFILGFVFLAGCATDPLTRALKTNGFCPILPIPEKQELGNIYRTYSLNSLPVVFIDDIFTKEENEKTMADLKRKVYLPASSGEKTFSLSAKADVIGKVEGTLKALRVKKFKLKLGDVYQYDLTEDRLENVILPAIRSRKPHLNLKDRYIVLALLQVSSLEYELIDENDKKIEIAPGSEIEKIVKSSLSIEWKANEQSSLVIGRPCFLGYKVGRIIEKGGAYTVKNIDFPLQGGNGKLKVQSIPAQELRKLMRSNN
ncbi:MAG: hypothetical protein GX598_05005 [Elusimicrobia bacterium]|nr:hypothetical protein [Elusimicrobiota bacterium]